VRLEGWMESCDSLTRLQLVFGGVKEGLAHGATEAFRVILLSGEEFTCENCFFFRSTLYPLLRIFKP
jgi:hypothetical protein